MARRKAVLFSLAVVGSVLAWGTPAVAAPVPIPTVHSGDVTTCADAGLGGLVLATREAPAPGEVMPDAGEPGVTVDVDQLGSLDEQGRKLTEVKILDGYFLTGVVVVGGGSYHVYRASNLLLGPDTLVDLVAPPQSGTAPRLSRYLVCGGVNLRPDPTTHDGDVTTCAAAGLSGSILVEGALPPGTSSAPDDGDPITGTVGDIQHTGPDEGRLLLVRTEIGTTISGVVVAGTDQYNLYTGPFDGPVVLSGLVAPPPGEQSPIIQHYFVCGGPAGGPTTTTTTTSTSTTTTTTTAPELADTGETPSSATMIGLVSAGAALVVAGATVLLVLRRRRAVTGG